MPSWDEDQMGKYGIAMHTRAVTAPFRAERTRRDAELVEKYLDPVLALLEDAPTARERATYAIPRVVYALVTVEAGIARENWRELLAAEIYLNAQREESHLPSFDSLSEGEKKPFHDVVDAITSVRKSQTVQAKS